MKTATKSKPSERARSFKLLSDAQRRERAAAAAIRVIREKLNRFLPETSNEAGRWHAGRLSYQVGIQDCFADPRVRELTVCGAERTGKTTIASNCVGYAIDRKPGSILWVMPSREAMADLLSDEIAPMIEASVVLRSKVGVGSHHIGKTNNVRRKSFVGGTLTCVGGGSSGQVAFRSAKFVILDEVDKLKILVGEGDADALAAKRASTYPDGVVIRLSKPTLEESSRIWRHYLRGSQGKWNVQCPGCHELQVLEWDRLRFEDVRLGCVKCEQFFSQDDWSDQPGEWIEGVVNLTHKSFQLSVLPCALVPWRILIEEFTAAAEALESGDSSLMQVFRNSRLGEVFSAITERLDDGVLYDRREYFGEATVPNDVIGVTIGADTQSDGFYWLCVGWGRRNECWLLATGRIIGDMDTDKPWQELDGIFDRLWPDGQGGAYKPLLCALDIQGTHYQPALEWCKQRAFKGVRAVRGLGVDKRKSTGGGAIIRGAYHDKVLRTRVQNLDVDSAKTLIATLLAQKEPGAGYVHIPRGPNGEEVRGFDSDTIAELSSEYRRKTVRNGYPVYTWYRRSGRPNHRFDCFCYALAAALLSRVKFDSADSQRIPKAELERRAQGSQAQGPPIQKYGVLNPPAGQESSQPTGPRPYGAQKEGGFWPSHQFGDDW
jgi:phage terminase large subunit GpA-like protein